MKNKFRLAIMASVVILVAIPAWAHHSFNAQFDTTKPLTLRGTVVKFELINPHGILTMDVKDAADKVTRWQIEFGNPNVMIRAGWRRDALKPGDEVIVEGYAARDGSNYGAGARFTLPDGRRLIGGQPVEFPDKGASPATPPAPSK